LDWLPEAYNTTTVPEKIEDQWKNDFVTIKCEPMVRTNYMYTTSTETKATTTTTPIKQT